jgi:hypothetical protein
LELAYIIAKPDIPASDATRYRKLASYRTGFWNHMAPPEVSSKITDPGMIPKGLGNEKGPGAVVVNAS